MRISEPSNLIQLVKHTPHSGNAGGPRPKKRRKYYRLAMSKIDRMSEREKFRTRGGYYLLVGDYEKAIEQFTQLTKQYPFDSAGIGNIWLFVFRSEKYERRARRRAQSRAACMPEHVLQLNNVSLFAMYAGDFNGAIRI